MSDNALDSGMRPKLARRARLQTDRVTGKPILLFPEGVLVLNRTAVAIAELCDGVRTIDEIASALTERYGATGVQTDVMRFLRRLHDHGLLTIADGVPAFETGSAADSQLIVGAELVSARREGDSQ
jgi:pyrroloquinoline quinone biosynthesis protein D